MINDCFLLARVLDTCKKIITVATILVGQHISVFSYFYFMGIINNLTGSYFK